MDAFFVVAQRFVFPPYALDTRATTMPEARKRRIIQEDDVDEEEEVYAPPQKQSRKTESGSRPSRNKVQP